MRGVMRRCGDDEVERRRERMADAVVTMTSKHDAKRMADAVMTVTSKRDAKRIADAVVALASKRGANG